MESLSQPDHVVHMNVGGVFYAAMRSTLTKFGDSTFYELCGQKYHDQDGRIFVDRDGPTFRHVLNFLRTGHLTLPGDFRDYDMLEEEAVFYRIEPLVQAVRLARLPTPAAKTGAKPIAFQFGSMLEVYQIEDSYGRGPNMTAGSLSVCGTRRVLMSLPFAFYPEENPIQDDVYHTVHADVEKKMALFDHLKATGWQLMTSPFTTMVIPQHGGGVRSTCIHKYVWSYPAA